MKKQVFYLLKNELQLHHKLCVIVGTLNVKYLEIGDIYNTTIPPVIQP